MFVTLALLLLNVCNLIFFFNPHALIWLAFQLVTIVMLASILYKNYKCQTFDWTIICAAVRVGFIYTNVPKPRIHGMRVRRYGIPTCMYRWIFHLETILFPWRKKQMFNFVTELQQLTKKREQNQKELLELCKEMKAHLSEKQ